MLKKVLIILTIMISILNCKNAIINKNVNKIIIEDRTHEYVGKELDKVEITDNTEINRLINKINEYEEYIAKFEGKYYIIIEYENNERLRLRTNGINFEIISELKHKNIRYFKIKNTINLLDYFN